MLRFVILRKYRDALTGLETEGLYTVDAECPELEREMIGGGYGENGYDVRELKGAEILPEEAAKREGRG